jgi:putative ABC transport system permease protein
MAFARNAAFQRNYDYGYDRKNVMGVRVSDRNTYEAYRNAVQHLPGVAEMAGTRHHVGFGYRYIQAESEGEKREVSYLEVGDNYLNTMNLRTSAGRAFDPRMESDYENAMLVSQKFAGRFGWKDEEALGKQVRIDTMTYTVVGTLSDFHSKYPSENLDLRLRCIYFSPPN